MSSGVRITSQGKAKDLGTGEAADHADLDTTIPLGLRAFAEVMQADVAALVGAKYSRSGGAPRLVRWGRQRGSIFLGDQKVPVNVQRIRDRAQRQEIPLQSYQRLQTPQAADVGLFSARSWSA